MRDNPMGIMKIYHTLFSDKASQSAAWHRSSTATSKVAFDRRTSKSYHVKTSHEIKLKKKLVLCPRSHRFGIF